MVDGEREGREGKFWNEVCRGDEFFAGFEMGDWVGVIYDG